MWQGFSGTDPSTFGHNSRSSQLQPAAGGFDAQWGYPFYFATTQEITKADNNKINVTQLLTACLGFSGTDPSTFGHNSRFSVWRRAQRLLRGQNPR